MCASAARSTKQQEKEINKLAESDTPVEDKVKQLKDKCVALVCHPYIATALVP